MIRPGKAVAALPGGGYVPAAQAARGTTPPGRIRSSYYRSASVYLCLSEHEGYCVPLVEVLHYGCPSWRASPPCPALWAREEACSEPPDPVLSDEVLARVLGDEALLRTFGQRSSRRLETFRPAVAKDRPRRVLCSRFGMEIGRAKEYPGPSGC